MSNKQVAQVKCPECGHESPVEVPQNACLHSYKCDGCNKVISVPSDSENCCVVCEYSDDECPFPNKHKKKPIGFEPTEEDIQYFQREIEKRNPELATREVALQVIRELQLRVRDGLREIALDDPSALDDILENLPKN